MADQIKTGELGSLIELGNDYDVAPKNLCPYCSRELHLTIDAFKPEITKVVRSNCPYCGGEIFALLVIVTDKTHKGILGALQGILNLFNPEKTSLIDKGSIQ